MKTIYRQILIMTLFTLGVINCHKAYGQWVPFSEYFDYYALKKGNNEIGKARPVVQQAVDNANDWREIGIGKWQEDFIGGELEFNTWDVVIKESNHYPGVYSLQPYKDITLPEYADMERGFRARFHEAVLYIDATIPNRVKIGYNDDLPIIISNDTNQRYRYSTFMTSVCQGDPEGIYFGNESDEIRDKYYGHKEGNIIKFAPGSFWNVKMSYSSFDAAYGGEISTMQRPLDGCGLTITLPENPVAPDSKETGIEVSAKFLRAGANPPVPQEIIGINTLVGFENNYDLYFAYFYESGLFELYYKVYPGNLYDVTEDIATEVISSGTKLTWSEKKMHFGYDLRDYSSGIYSFVFVGTNWDGKPINNLIKKVCWQEYNFALQIGEENINMLKKPFPTTTEYSLYSDDIFSSVYPEKYPFTKPYQVEVKKASYLPGFYILRDPYCITKVGQTYCGWEHYDDDAVDEYPQGPFDILIDVRNPDKVVIPACLLTLSDSCKKWAMVESLPSFNKRMGLEPSNLYGTYKNDEIIFPASSLVYYDSESAEVHTVNKNGRFKLQLSPVPLASTDDVMAEASTIPTAIYNMQGVLLKRAASQADIDALPAGLYIIGGKKVMKR